MGQGFIALPVMAAARRAPCPTTSQIRPTARILKSLSRKAKLYPSIHPGQLRPYGLYSFVQLLCGEVRTANTHQSGDDTSVTRMCCLRGMSIHSLAKTPERNPLREWSDEELHSRGCYRTGTSLVHRRSFRIEWRRCAGSGQWMMKLGNRFMIAFPTTAQEYFPLLQTSKRLTIVIWSPAINADLLTQLVKVQSRMNPFA